ncbi:hypothetical protein [Streptomyces sp. V1I6]|uniref:hypothetical protein n=1 Tax=Streptomyces sp. V1I6 TaxID=3042273 RepID=UPI002789EE11|nr:hypothetical protein [Streptomyces sp. V1I6]MDQ0842040.1 hypothetical protein [Streptomyces sp. V1I6]
MGEVVLDALERQAPYGEGGAEREMEGAGVQHLRQVGLGVAHGSSGDVERRTEVFTSGSGRSQRRVTPH